MSTLLVRGGMDVHGRSLDVTVVDGEIAEPGVTGEPDRILDADGLTVVPGLMDLQVNGAAGLDITAQPESLWEIAAVLAGYGVTAFMPTVITADAATRDSVLATFRAGPPEGWAGAVPLGIHFEGPMLAPTRRGAHPPHLLAAPSLDLVAGWSREAGILMATVAPELPGAIEVVEQLVARGVVVCVGHTAPTPPRSRPRSLPGHRIHAPRQRDARDARPRGRPRRRGPRRARLVAGVIADGHHLHPSTL